MKFSLIMGTVGKTDKLNRFLDSLQSQTYKNFELLVIDQSRDDTVKNIIAPYKQKYEILQFESDFGLSRARNLGLKHFSGDIIGFPDDDCWYSNDLLENVANAFCQCTRCDGLSGRVVDADQKNVTFFAKKKSYITRLNAWSRASSITLFFRKELVKEVGCFDESLGIGAGTKWLGAEDIDYPIRAAKLGFKVLYDPELTVFHPVAISKEREDVDRAFNYNAAIGRVWMKHDYPAPIVGYYLLRSLGGAVYSWLLNDKDRQSYYLKCLAGRWVGWRSK